MNAIKKSLALLLTMIMSFTLIACGSNGGNKSTSKDLIKTPEADTPTPTEAAERAEFPSFDMGGRTIKIASWYDTYYDSEHTKIDDNPNVINAELAQMSLDNLRRVEKKYNVKIDLVTLSWQGMIESINTSIAAGTPEMDIYTTDLQFGIPAVANGMALPISSYAAEYTDLAGDRLFIETMETFGDNFLFRKRKLPTDAIFIAYNANIISSLGLEDPQSLYEKGQWTYEKFAEYARAATKDTNGDGLLDQYGYCSIFGTNMGFFYSNNGIIAPGEKENLSSDNVTEAFNFINQLYNVDKSAVYLKETDNQFNENLYAWTKGNILFWGAYAWVLGNGKSEYGVNFDYHVVPFPKGPSGDGTIYSAISGSWYMLPRGVQSPEKVYQVFEEYVNWFNYDTSLIYNKESLEPYFVTQKDMDIALDVGSKEVLDLYNKIGFNFEEVHNTVIFGNMSVAQAVETYKPILQSRLDYIYHKD